MITISAAHPITQLDSVDSLIDQATRADGVAPFSEPFLRGLREADSGHHHLLAIADDAVVGLAAYESTGDSPAAELVVAPHARRRGIAAALVAQLPAEAQLWAHGNIPAAQACAAALAWQPVRELLVMSLTEPQLTEVLHRSLPLPEQVHLKTYSQSVAEYGTDMVDRAWLQANNEAFSWHPEQGGWDLARLERARDTSWYHPEDVLLLWKEAQLLGFHWTKFHGELPQLQRYTGPVGEVYVVGLADAARGQGLGAPLLQAGIARQVQRGAQTVLLYVEADNAPAVRAYEDLGMTVTETHMRYSRG